MHRTRLGWLLSMLLLTLPVAGSGCLIAVQTEPVVTTVETRPPPPRQVARPRARTGHVWVEGHWERRGNRWVWRDGHWKRSRASYTWVDGHWEDRGGTWIWIEGRWVAGSSQPGERRVVPNRGTVVTPGR